jgi:murein L,D-transpeptidase YcbB/YkuD
VQYAVHAQAGRFVPQQVSEFLDPTLDIPNAGAILSGVERAGSDVASYLEGFHPTHPQFKALKAELGKILKGAESQRPAEIPAKGPVLKPGESHADVALLRERLGAPANPAGNEIYDEILADAVKAYQQRSGLQPDGMVGPATRAAFALPAAPDRDTLIANMERWRWLPRDMGETYIRANIPEFMVRVEDRGNVIFEERIIVGKPETKTPVFSDQMKTVVFNPFWNVPGSIALKQILPLVRSNPSYLERNNLQVFIGGRRRPVDPYYVNWDTVNPDDVFIRQPPGDDNALGHLKFLFPNKHAVYMHDTPTKHLFNQTVRAYSHGCVRVRNPKKFAEVLLRHQGWNMPRIEKSIASKVDDINVQLETRIPVHLTYFTLWADDEGRIRRFRDLYGHDRLTLTALRSARS